MTTQFQNTSPEAIRERILAAPATRRPSAYAYFLYYLRHKPLGTIGLSIVVLMILTAVFAPLIAPYTYQEQNYQTIRQSPNLNFFFGTDMFEAGNFRFGLEVRK